MSGYATIRLKLAGAEIDDPTVQRAFDEAFVSGYRERDLDLSCTGTFERIERTDDPIKEEPRGRRQACIVMAVFAGRGNVLNETKTGAFLSSGGWQADRHC